MFKHNPMIPTIKQEVKYKQHVLKLKNQDRHVFMEMCLSNNYFKTIKIRKLKKMNISSIILIGIIGSTTLYFFVKQALNKTYNNLFDNWDRQFDKMGDNWDKFKN